MTPSATLKMPTDTLFRFSSYLSLAFSCLCIGYAEREIFPEVSAFAFVAILALIVLFQMETRIELLSLEAANRLGLVLGLLCFAWASCRIFWEIRHNNFVDTPWLMMLPALVGPLLIASMPAKLARREKHVGDYRFLCGMGLAGAILAGVLAEDLACFLLVILYVVSTVWSLSLLYIRQSGGAILPVPNSPLPIPITGAIVGTGKQHSLMRIVVFILVAATVAVPLYLVTPRSMAEKLSFANSRIEIAYSPDQMTDLNRTGTLKANDEIAFEVTAEVEGKPKTNLSLEQRWKGTVLREYDKGIWKPGLDIPLPGIGAKITDPKIWSPPSLGPGQCSLSFSIPKELPGHFLADPVVWADHQATPVASWTPTGLHGLRWIPDGSFVFDRNEPTSAKLFHYRQEWREESDPDVSPPFHLFGFGHFLLEYTLSSICLNPVDRVKDYAQNVVQQMINRGVLPRDCRNSHKQLPKREYHDVVAKGFSQFLSTTPTLRYTTKLQRQNTAIDPIEDFLFNTRAGHCERFATALALMLRSQDIPAVLVLGFKGCESTNEPGKYLVRQENAHVWVAALIQDYEPSTVRGEPRPMSRWRSLDPTPGLSNDHEELGGTAWTAPAVAWLNKQFQSYLVDYSKKQRQHALDRLVTAAAEPESFLILLGILGSALLLRRWLRSRNTKLGTTPFASHPFYQRFVSRLRRHGFIPRLGETPLEFATRVSAILRRNPKTSAVAEVPLDWVESFYEVRFGDRAISEQRRGQLESRLDELIRVVSRNSTLRDFWGIA